MNPSSQAWPDRIADVDALEELLSRPTPTVVDLMGRLEGDLIVLGVAGKIGPSLARMARRASEEAGVRRRVIGVARFSSPQLAGQLESWGIETIRCDLLNRAELEALPDVPNVLHLAAMKFGSTGQEAATWAMNAYLPGMVCEKYRRSRIVSYSTGNVYPLSRVGHGGSSEEDPLGPIGDYAMSCAGRERIVSYFSQRLEIPAALLRLNYAHEMRYGVMVDLAQQVMAGRPIDLAMGYFNAIWQGDSNAMTLRAFDHVTVPARPINLAGREELSVRKVAEQLGRLLECPAVFSGCEATDALLSDGRLGHRLLGEPTVSIKRMMGWIADWQRRGGATHGKPTKFQVRDGHF